MFPSFYIIPFGLSALQFLVMRFNPTDSVLSKKKDALLVAILKRYGKQCSKVNHTPLSKIFNRVVSSPLITKTYRGKMKE
mgnify:CR=1 FL=1